MPPAPRRRERFSAAPPKLALLALTLLAPVGLEILGREARHTGPDSSQALDPLAALLRIVDEAANPHLLAIRLEHHLVARLDADLLADLLWDDDLSLRSDLVSHTAQYN